MKAAVVNAPRNIQWKDVEDPQVQPGWARIAIGSVGICSSDVGRALEGSAYFYPIILGHEMSGIVDEVGDDVSPDWIGKRVAIAPLIPCGDCEWCKSGRFGLCDEYDYLGSRRAGGCAEYTTAPVENLVIVPDTVSLESASIIEPASVTLHGLDGRVRAGDDVVILGSGNLGLFAVQQASILGAGRVFAVDTQSYRLDLAEELGAIPIQVSPDHTAQKEISRLTSTRMADVVLDTCGIASVQASLPELARKGGKVVYLGLPHADVCINPQIFNWLVRSEIETFGSWNSFSAPFPGSAWTANVQYLESGQLKVDEIITHRFPMREAGEAYRFLKDTQEPNVKVLLVNET